MKGKLILSVEAADKNHDEWLRVRNEGLGGSDMGSLLGFNPWKSPFALWEEKVDPSKAEDISDNPVVKLGSFLEQYVADEFVKETGKKLTRRGTLADEEFPFLHANVDRMVVGEEVGLEIKTASMFKQDQWEGDKVPDAYYLQIQFYMMITGASKWYIACLFRDNGEWTWKEVPRNDKDIEILRQKAVEFWTVNVQQRIAPPADGSASTREMLGKMYDNPQDAIIAIPAEYAASIKSWDEIKAAKKLLADQEDKIKNQFMALLGNNEHGLIGDRKVNWVNHAGALTIDKDKLAEKYPEAYADCLHRGKPSRTFTITVVKPKKEKKKK